MKQGDQWMANPYVPHIVPTCSLIEVKAMHKMLNGEWRTFVDTDDIYWEDNNLLQDDKFWFMVAQLRSGKWK